MADGLYDFRATATDNAGRTTTSASSTNRRIDNTNPVTATLAAVGTNLAGNVNFTGTAADNTGGSGVGSWKVQTSPTGAGTWTDLCTDTTTPFGACTGNVDGLADGIYDFRAVVTDLAGNTLASTVQTGKRVDTDGPVTSVASPANNARVSGNVTMTANATDPAGVTQRGLPGLPRRHTGSRSAPTTPRSTPARATRPRSPTAPTRPAWSRPTASGTRPNSATITLIIDNTHPTANDVQRTTAAPPASIDAGDTVTFTWSEPMAPASILTGWSGAATAGPRVRRQQRRRQQRRDLPLQLDRRDASSTPRAPPACC